MVTSQGISREFELVTAYTGALVELSDLRLHLSLDCTDFDSLLSDIERMAVERVENETRRQLKTATWKMYLPYFPCLITIRKAPVASITQIRYVDTDGAWQVLASSVYETFLNREPAEIMLDYQQTWPLTRTKEQAVEITFVAGYGESDDVPQLARQAVKLIVKDQFDQCDGNETAIRNLISQMQWGM